MNMLFFYSYINHILLYFIPSILATICYKHCYVLNTFPFIVVFEFSICITAPTAGGPARFDHVHEYQRFLLRLRRQYNIRLTCEGRWRGSCTGTFSRNHDNALSQVEAIVRRNLYHIYHLLIILIKFT